MFLVTQGVRFPSSGVWMMLGPRDWFMTGSRLGVSLHRGIHVAPHAFRRRSRWRGRLWVPACLYQALSSGAGSAGSLPAPHTCSFICPWQSSTTVHIVHLQTSQSLAVAWWTALINCKCTAVCAITWQLSEGQENKKEDRLTVLLTLLTALLVVFHVLHSPINSVGWNYSLPFVTGAGLFYFSPLWVMKNAVMCYF